MTDLLYYPDKPFASNPERIPAWDASNQFILQQKIDGWRMVFQFTPSGVKCISRRNKDYTKEVFSCKLIAERLAALHKILPPNTHLDGEWLSRRSCSKEYKLPERVYLFDIMIHDGVWWNKEKLLTRWETLQKYMALIDSDAVSLIPCAKPGDFVNFYENQKKIVYSEGVVAKHKASTLSGNRRNSVDNPQWYKVRYRGGVDGEITLDQIR